MHKTSRVFKTYLLPSKPSIWALNISKLYIWLTVSTFFNLYSWTPEKLDIFSHFSSNSVVYGWRETTRSRSRHWDTLPRFHSAEGIYCPKFRDMATGRYRPGKNWCFHWKKMKKVKKCTSLEMLRTCLFVFFWTFLVFLEPMINSMTETERDWRYENTAPSAETLTFQEDGRWCIGTACSKKIGGENPIGAILEQFEAGERWLANVVSSWFQGWKGDIERDLVSNYSKK